MKTPCPDTTSSARSAPREAGGWKAEPDRAQRQALAERVAQEMAAIWGQGGQPSSEEFLAKYPDVAEDPESAARVIYEEVCLREGLGKPVHTSEILARFPRWRVELQMLLDCHEMARPRLPVTAFPEVGDRLGDFQLLSILGTGQRGSVFLATQQTLANRPVVLKVIPRGGGEHLSLARLQHPHVVPLYAVHDFPERDLRVLCMPYLGGLTLSQVLDRMANWPIAERSGADFLRVLDGERTNLGSRAAWSGSRHFFAGATYPRAVCWVAACLAEALHSAHARGLLHLDLKPSNILLADDGQPMLLDFHLARDPLGPGDAWPDQLGGTEGYMSPEQQRAMEAVRDGRPIPGAVDERSDLFSLGVTIHEALSGSLPAAPGATAASLLKLNPSIGAGLAGIVIHCLARHPDDRYPNAEALASDLRRYLGYLPPIRVPRQGMAGIWLAARRAWNRLRR
ncbi:MAG: hypothetical protein NVSMB9_03410 [Isosphaeraceae bacterium]